MGKNCRFEPTCSQYAKESIEVHGAFIGGYYSLVRILKCGPWSVGGTDEVRKLIGDIFILVLLLLCHMYYFCPGMQKKR